MPLKPIESRSLFPETLAYQAEDTLAKLPFVLARA